MDEIAWDLSGMFETIESPKIEETMNLVLEKADLFANKYKNLLDSENINAKKLYSMLEEYQDIYLDAREVSQFASLSYSANQSLMETKKLNEKARSFSMQVSRKLTFFDVGLGKLLLKHPELVNNAELSKYKHYLEKELRAAPYNLSEAEEKLAISLNKNGVNAWQQFQASHLGSLEFTIDADGKTHTVGFGAALGFLHHSDKSVRKNAHMEIFGKLMSNGEIFATALRNITSFHVINSELRGYEDTLHSSLVANDIERSMFDSLSKVILEGKKHFQHYLKIKAKLMEQEKLSFEDVTAPVNGLPELKFTWDEAKSIIIKAYSEFDPEFGTIITDMFDNNRIDASPRKGKRQGAFCSGWSKGKSAFVLLSFNGNLGSLYTLAHELGHAIHAYLNERQEPLLNQRYPMVIAEVASEFGEMILTKLLLEQAKSNDEKKAILVGLLDNFGQSIFQVFSRTIFEHGTYKAVKDGDFLDANNFAKMWKTVRDDFHGDIVKWADFMDYDMWTWKPHPYMPHFRYYNYPYVWSQLMVLALYELYEEIGNKFVPKYKNMLAAGGSKSPKELAKDMGFDLSSPEFWQLGMKQYIKMVKELEKLT